MKKLSVKTKKTVISVTAGVAAAAILGGVVFGLRGRGEPVGVYPFSMVGMTEFWGDNQESYGPVTTDRIQTVFLSDTQTITEVKVKEGDEVKKGDVLMTYDTTLSELQLERKRLDVEKANLQVREAQEELARINQLKPMESVDVEVDLPVESANYGRELSGAYEIANPDEQYDGSSPEKAVICWLKDSTPVNNALLRQLYYQAMMNQITNDERIPSSGSAEPTPEEESKDEELLLEEETGNADSSGQTEENENGNNDENQGDDPNETDDTENLIQQTPEEPPEPDDTENLIQQTPEEPPEPDAFTLFAMRAPESLQIYCGDVYDGGVVQVTSGDAVNLTFTSSVTDWEHSNFVRWELSPKTGGTLTGQRNGRGFTVSGVTSTIGETAYTVTAIY